MTPLQLACWSAPPPTQAPVVRALLEHGASITAIAASGRTTLLCSALNNQCDPAVLRDLITRTKAAGMSVDYPNVPRSLGWKLYTMVMTLKYRMGVRNHLVMYMATLKRLTPLMGAAIRGDASAVRMLLDAGADRNKRNAVGLNALAISRAFGPFPDVEELLQTHVPRATAK